MSSKLLILTAAIAITITTTLGCTETSAESTASSRQDVLNGQLSGTDDDAVVNLSSTSASGSIWGCSGTLVAPNVVLTARHCIANFADGKFTCDADGNLVGGSVGGLSGTLDTPGNITIRTGPGPKVNPAAHGLSIFAAQTTTICRNDIALVVLDKELTNFPIKPMRLYQGTLPGEHIRVVGYGVNSDGGLGTRYTRSGATIAKVGTSQFRPTGDAIPPRTFMTTGPLLCEGDSGGPALSDNEAVIGVFSQFTGLCTDANTTDYFTEVAPFTNDIVLPAFEAAGAVPWLENNSEPGLYGTGGSVSATGGDSSTGGSAAVSTSGGSTSVSNATGGAPAETGGDTSVFVYDQAAKGGSCACRAAGNGRRGFGVLVAVAAMLGLRRRRRSLTKGNQ